MKKKTRGKNHAFGKGIALAIALVIGICGLLQVIDFSGEVTAPTTISEDCIGDLVKASRERISFEDIKPVKVGALVDGDTFKIGKNEYPYIASVLDGYRIYSTQSSKKIPKRLISADEAAKKLLFMFVDQYFEESNQIKEEIDKYTMVVSKANDGFFTHENGSIYVSPAIIKNLNRYSDDMLVFCLLHEYIHAVRSITRESEEMVLSRLSEAMTEAITWSIFPCDEIVTTGGYSDSLPYGFALISRYGEDAIQAYFYTFDILKEKAGPNNWKAYCFLSEIMQHTVRDDGVYDDILYLGITGIRTTEEVYRDALRLIAE